MYETRIQGRVMKAGDVYLEVISTHMHLKNMAPQQMRRGESETNLEPASSV